MFSALYMKAGFHNVPIPTHLQKYAGVLMQDGLYVWFRMPFGYNMAPAHFSHVMHTLLNAQPHDHIPNHATYVDDIHIGGYGIWDTWRDTRETLRRLTRGGLLLRALNLQLLRQ